jgi:hypothetical protein
MEKGREVLLLDTKRMLHMTGLFKEGDCVEEIYSDNPSEAYYFVSLRLY